MDIHPPRRRLCRVRRIPLARAGALLVALLSALVPLPALAGTPPPDPPFHCYLTWQGDPTTTITINFQTVNSHTPVEVLYDTVSHDGTPRLYPHRVAASSHTIPGLNTIAGAQRFIHVAELIGLAPGGTYYFTAGSIEGGYTAQRSVTLPTTDMEGLRFIDGGDMPASDFVPPLLQAAAAQSPAFGLVGGDLAYEDGALANFALWDAWLTNWETYMITPEGRTVPMIIAIGNHEVAGGFGGSDDPFGRASFYFGYFAQDGHGFVAPRSTYFRRDFGPDVSLLVLDSGHIAAPAGAQADWIDEQLAQLGDVDLRMAAYHVPMYPSHRSFTLPEIANVRDAWLPRFDAGALDAAFEHHDHMLKRTKPLRASQSDAHGTVYFGDGCFGQTPRTGAQAAALSDPAVLQSLGLSQTYLAHWAPARHFWLAEVTVNRTTHARQFHVTALDANAAVLDETSIALDRRGGTSGNHCIASVLLGADRGALPVLRAFRDRRMLMSAPGAALSDAYYRMSPGAVAWLNARPRALGAAQAVVQWLAEHIDTASFLVCAFGSLMMFAVLSGRVHRTAAGADARRHGIATRLAFVPVDVARRKG